MTIESLDDLFPHTLKDVLYAERKIRRELPKMERKQTAATLKATLSSHREETETHIIRLEDVSEGLGKAARGAKCDAMVGLIEETEGLMSETDDTGTPDAAIVSLAQAVEHCEIARYGTRVTWAQQLGHPQAEKLLKETLNDEHDADKALTQLAEVRLNAAA